MIPSDGSSTAPAPTDDSSTVHGQPEDSAARSRRPWLLWLLALSLPLGLLAWFVGAERPAEQITGWARVGGARLLRAKVLVDGRSVGYAPIELQLPVGSHQITVQRPADNALLLSQQVTILATHRRATPLRVIR